MTYRYAVLGVVFAGIFACCCMFPPPNVAPSSSSSSNRPRVEPTPKPHPLHFEPDSFHSKTRGFVHLPFTVTILKAQLSGNQIKVKLRIANDSNEDERSPLEVDFVDSNRQPYDARCKPWSFIDEFPAGSVKEFTCKAEIDPSADHIRIHFENPIVVDATAQLP